MKAMFIINRILCGILGVVWQMGEIPHNRIYFCASKIVQIVNQGNVFS